MKKYFLSLIALSLSLFAFGQSSLNMTLLGSASYMNDNNDIWGYTDSSGVEYALVGTTAGVSIVDVSGVNLVKKQFIQGPYSIWRDLKTWDHYAYIVHDAPFVWNTVPEHGLLIIDLDSVNTTPRFKNINFIIPKAGGGADTLKRAHNLYIDENGFCYLFGANVGNGGALIFDVHTDPWNPSYVGIYDDYYFHDGMVRGDTLWGSAVYQGFAAIVDVSKKDSTFLRATQTTPSSFTHNTWVSDNNQVLFTTDERTNGFLTAYDVSDLSNISELDRIQTSLSTDVIPHNAHVYGQWVITSYYTSGVQIVDAKFPELLVEVGYYDTSPAFSGNGFNGNWGAYPYFESEKVICSDIEEGLVVLEPNYVEASRVHIQVIDSTGGAPLVNTSLSFSESGLTATTNLDGLADLGTHLSIPDTLDVQLTGYVGQILPYQWLAGDFDTLTIELVPVTNIGAEEWSEKVIKISPNPSQGSFRLAGLTEGTFRLVNLTGTLLEEGVVQGEEIHLQQHYAHGNYLLQVQNHAGAWVFPVVLLP